MPISQSPTLQLVSYALATVGFGFGINALVRPAHALTFFEWELPAARADADLVTSLVAVYGVRDIFMGFALYAAAIWGTKKSQGWIVIATAAVAFADGYICYLHGGGQMNHWGYAPILIGVGAALNGWFD